jgi:transcriptional regulator with XRE-family HTH domain
LIGILLNAATLNVNRISINWRMPPLITIRQVKAARALLGWSQADLAHRSGISEPTIARLESAEGELGGREGTGEKIRRAIENAGVEFIDENGGGPGVRLRKAHRKKA